MNNNINRDVLRQNSKQLANNLSPPDDAFTVKNVPPPQSSSRVAPESTSSKSIQEWPKIFNNLPESEEYDLNKDNEEIITKIKELKSIRIFITTWNMYAKPPPEDISPLIKKNKYHIYCIATQECERGIAASMINTSKSIWISKVNETLGDKYTLIKSHTLQAINILLYIHKALIPYITDIQSQSIATGIGKTVGNKGGIGMSFILGNTSILFITSHFAAGQNGEKKRNIDQMTISTSLSLGEPLAPNVEDRFHHCFWTGDFNYRINGSRKMVDTLLKENLFEVLMNNDQLTINKKKGLIFQGFEEPPLFFRPTYKYDKGTDVYDTSKKHRIPSWTDRCVYKTKGKVECLVYSDENTMKTSDHNPVFCVFDVSVDLEKEELNTTLKANQMQSEVCIIQ